MPIQIKNQDYDSYLSIQVGIVSIIIDASDSNNDLSVRVYPNGINYDSELGKNFKEIRISNAGE